LLDGLVRYRFGENAELMGAWASARNVEGPFRSKAEPPAGSVTPPTIKGRGVMSSPPVPLSVPERGNAGGGEGKARWVRVTCRALLVVEVTIFKPRRHVRRG